MSNEASNLATNFQAGRDIDLEIHGDLVTGTKVEGHQYNAGGDIHIYQQTNSPKSPPKPFLAYEPETVLIPAGEFWMGSAADPLATPEHVVNLPAYRIGLFPITNDQFAQFIYQTKQAASPDLLWDGNQPSREQRRYPVVGVTWEEAIAYCAWLSQLTERPYTLPNEAQWEKAARGTDGRLYPWGNTWEPTLCNNNLNEYTAVDAFPPQSPYGCYDMVGNGREWTTTLWGSDSREPDPRYRYPWADDGRNDPTAPLTTRRIFRGGRGDEPTAYQCSRRGAYLPTRCGPRQQRHGFRIVLALP